MRSPGAQRAGSPGGVTATGAPPTRNGKGVLARSATCYASAAVRAEGRVLTEVRAGATTFMVMAYIISVNPLVLGFAGVPGLEGKGLPFAPTLTVTCLTAGVLSIAMGLATRYPLAMAPGMGLNAVVAFDLVAGRGLTWPQAMTVVLLEGVVLALLVLTRFREAVMDAVPVDLKRAIGVGIGFFIAFIGFFTSGFVVKPASGPLPVGLGALSSVPIVVFVLGFVLTAWLVARRVQGALLVGIVATTVLAIALNGVVGDWRAFPTPGAAQIPAAIVQAPDFSTFGRVDFGLFAKLGVVAAALVIFSIMLADFFDTIGTIIGVGGKGGFLDARGRLPRANRVLLVDSLGAALGGFANASSNTTYIESAAGVSEGARTGLASVTVGALFLLAMFFSPLAAVIPAQATAPALILVGFYMMSIAREIAWDDYEEAVPAFVTMLAMPFTWSITNGIGAGFVTWTAIKMLTGRAGQIHWMVYLTSAAFVVYFALPVIERALRS
jgi:AGZA family xanthine/uracil permease-like MFS transporter